MKRLAISAWTAAACTAAAWTTAAMAHAQQPMGNVATHDASISGSMEVHADRATLLSNDSIKAFDHTAAITLARGGEALVCATSEFHLLHSGSGPALIFALDRGAVQISSIAQAQDVVITPDIRFTVEAAGAFDLRLRVTREGDTCVENRGEHAPVLLLANAFGDATYRVLPGQHVLFEHGDLHQVVDHERTACGCPEEATTLVGPNASPAQLAAAEHPFPAAASQGLGTAPEAVSPPQTAAAANTDFRINAGDTAPIALTTTPPEPASSATATPIEQPKAPPGTHDLVHAIGGFFHRLLHGKPKETTQQ